MSRSASLVACLFALILVGASADPAPAADSSPPALRSCPGHVNYKGGLFWNIRATGVGCPRAKELIRAQPSNHGFRCRYTERLRGIGIRCSKQRPGSRVILSFLDSAR